MTIKPDDFKADPYGYLTNQLGHIALGVFFVFIVSRLWFEVFGEYPVRLTLWLVTGAVYFFIVELMLQGWRGLDTLEDTIFVWVYGAGAPLYAFKETIPGDPDLSAQMPALDAFFVAAGAHLLIGVGLRVYNKIAARIMRRP